MLLLRELLLGGFALRGVAQRALFRLVQLLHFFRHFLLTARQIARFRAEVAQFFPERAAALLPQVLTHFLKLPLGPRAGGKCLRHVAFGRGLGGLLNILPGLLQFLFLLGKLRLILRFFHPLI